MKKVPKFKKRKGYYTGGGVKDEFGNPILDVNGNPITSGENMLDVGGNEVVTSNYDNTSAKVPVTTTALDKSGQPKTKKDYSKQIAATKNAAGEAFGKFGSGYYATKQNESQGDSVRSAGLGAISNAGAIGGVIGGVAAIGDKIGDPVRKRSEALDAQGNVKDVAAAKRNAIFGIGLSPSKRLTYKGGLTDVTGDKYIASLEEAKKAELEQEKQAALDIANEDVLAKRNRGETGGSVLSTYRAPKKKGGEIVGKGNGTSDSINAELEEGAFVVPEKNSWLAEAIRKKVLKDNPKKKATLHKGEVPVKVSNGEHVFSEDEKKEIVAKTGEETLEALAPEAEENENELAKGTPKDGVKKEIPIGTKVYGATWDGKNWNLGGKFTEEGGKKYTDAYYKEQGSKKEPSWMEKKADQQLADYNKKLTDEYESLKGKNDEVANFTRKELEKKLPSLKTKKETFSTPAVKTGAQLEGKKSVAKKPSASANQIWSDSLKFTPKILTDDEINIDNSNILNPNANAIDTVPITKTEMDKPFLASIDKGKQEYEAEKLNQPTNTRGNFWDKVNNVNTGNLLNTGLGVFQVSKGLEGLKGERPVAKIDPTFSKNVDTAQAQAEYGLTPEQRALVNQQNQNALNQEIFAAKNFAGGSGGNAYNMTRSALNNAFTRNLQTEAMDTELKQGKQAQASQLALQRANMSRAIFEDSLNAFNTKQTSAGNLLGAGIGNLMDSNRFSQYMKLKEDENNFKQKYG